MRVSAEQICVRSGDSLIAALKRMNEIGGGFLFVTSPARVLLGVVTDGDIRRALIKGITLDSPVEKVMNPSFCKASMKADRKEVEKNFSDKIAFIPLLDDDGKIVDYVTRERGRHFPLVEPMLGGNELEYVVECINTGWISSQGRFVTKFEADFATIHALPASQAIAVSNGTTALHLALASLGIGPGDEVIVPDFTFAATANAVVHAGATPVLAEVEPSTWGICPNAVAKLITPKTKAIIPVHLYGQPCRMDEILVLAKKHGLFIVEDCAESLGATYGGKATGTLGDAGTFSFFGNKTVTTGEGGMVLFRSPEAAERARILRDHGMSKERRYWHLEVGYNYRMTNLQAAIGVAQLERFRIILEKKSALEQTYRECLRGLEAVELQQSVGTSQPTCWLFTLLLNENLAERRPAIMEALLRRGVESRSTFFPLHEMPAFHSYVKMGQSFPVADSLSRRGLSLPSSIQLEKDDIRHIAKTVHDVFSMDSLCK